MRSLWLKIGLGAAGIFVVGMMGVTLVSNAKAAAVNAIEDLATRGGRAVQHAAIAAAAAQPVEGSPAQLASLRGLGGVGGATSQFVAIPFRVDGVELGTMNGGTIRRTRSNSLPVISIDVALTESDARNGLEECVLVPRRHRGSDFDGGFRCASNFESDLVTFGTVHFEPGGFTRPLMLTSEQADGMRKGEPFEARATLSEGVHVVASGDKGGLVQVNADERGANIQIHDEQGNDIFRLLADSLGASLRVRGKDGRDIVRLSAGDGRFSLNVDTTAAH
jgi:hypothetical protein